MFVEVDRNLTGVADVRSGVYARSWFRPVAVALALVVTAGCGGASTREQATMDVGGSQAGTQLPGRVVEPPESGPSDPIEGQERMVPAWSLDHLSGDGRVITVSIAQPCGGRYESPRVDVDEDAREVRLLVSVYEAKAPSGCEANYAPVPFDVALSAPLGSRSVIDASTPDRVIEWVVAPGAVRAVFRLEVEPGAIDPALDPSIFIAFGMDEPQVPVPLGQLYDGELLPVPLVLAPGSPHDGVLGFLDDLPLVPGSARGIVRSPIPAWDPSAADQVLVLTWHSGAVTGSGRVATAHPDRMTMSWAAV